VPLADNYLLDKRVKSIESLTTTEIRRVRVNELVGGMTASFSDDTEDDLSDVGRDLLSPVAFRVCGIIPWTSAWPGLSCSYQVAVWLTTFAACSYIIVHILGLVGNHGLVCSGVDLEAVCSHPSEPVSELPIALGAMVGLALLGRCGFSVRLASDLDLLKAYAFKQEFLVRWERRLLVDKGCVVAVWLLANASQCGPILVDGLQHASGTDLAHALAFTIVSTIMSGLVFCMLFACRALALMVDTFCSRIVDCSDLTMTVEEWNVLQAVLRKVSAAIEYCFIALQGVMLFTMPLILADFYLLGAGHSTLVKVLPSVFTMLAVLRMFALASIITDKCTRVPALINSLPFSPETAVYRQCIVDYIISSAAGFYVCDVRLNMGLALKFMYGWSVLAFGLITHLFSTTRG